MKTTKIESQLVVRNETLVNDLQINSKYIIYSGLGHTVLSVEALQDNQELLDKIKEENKDKYFYRMSFMEDKEDNNEIHLYLITNKLQYHQPKRLETGQLCFMGLDFTIIKLKKISKSENKDFDNVFQFSCSIERYTIDENNGGINKEILWEKVKYGNIENFLPKKLKKFLPFVKSARKRLK